MVPAVLTLSCLSITHLWQVVTFTWLTQWETPEPRLTAITALAHYMWLTCTLTTLLITYVWHWALRITLTSCNNKHIFTDSFSSWHVVEKFRVCALLLLLQPSGPSPNVSGAQESQHRPITLGLHSQNPPSLLQAGPREPMTLHLQADTQRNSKCW